MGSQKYPGENEFDSFVSCHGGTSDASTDYETVRSQDIVRILLGYCLDIIWILYFTDCLSFWN